MEDSPDNKEPSFEPSPGTDTKKRSFILGVLSGLSDRYWIFIGLDGHGAEVSEHLHKKRVRFHVALIVTLAVFGFGGWFLKGCSDADHEVSLNDTIMNLQSKKPLILYTNAAPQSPPSPTPVTYQYSSGNSANVANSPNAQVSQSITNQGPVPEIESRTIKSINVEQTSDFNLLSTYGTKVELKIINSSKDIAFSIHCPSLISRPTLVPMGSGTELGEAYSASFSLVEVVLETSEKISDSDISISVSNQPATLPDKSTSQP